MKKCFIIQLFILIQVVSLLGQTRHYVNLSATGANTGQAWQDAFTDLHQALNMALAGDEIWVAEGEYLTDTATNRDRSFLLKSGVKIYGGFHGTEQSLAQRSIQIHPTVLSGNIGAPTDSTDNAYTILYMAYPDTSTRLDGLTFQHGYAISDTNFFNLSPVLSGGAVYILAKSGKALPVFVNCTFRNNVARSRGGAVFVHGQNSTGSTPKFEHCVFFNNKSLGSGGAIFISGGNNLDRGIEFDHCRFDSNSAGAFGGSISMENAFGSETLNFRSCTITNSYAYLSGGFMYVSKSGVNASKITIDRCQISKNKASNGPSGLYVESSWVEFPTIFKLKDSEVFDNEDAFQNSFLSYGGVIVLGDFAPFSPIGTDTFIVSGNKIFNNKSYFGIISLNSYNAYADIQDNLLFGNGNTQVLGGLGIGVGGKRISIHNNVCYDNTVLPLYGLIYAYNDSKLVIHDNLLHDNLLLGNANTYYSTSVIGAGVSTFFGFTDIAQVFNNTFYKNTTWITENISTASFPQKIYSNNIFTGNIDFLTGNPTIPLSLGQDSILFRHNLIDVDCGSLPYSVVCGPNNLFNLDPQFRDPANHDYSLLPCSPLINAGSNLAAANILTDLAGNPRIQGGTVDIGAFESPSFTLASAPSIKPACVGAANGSISLDPVFGCEPYTYQWLPQVGNGPELNGLAPGTYQLTLTDGRGQQILDTFQVAAAALPALSPIATDVQCSTGLGGSISAGVTQGTAPYQMQWSPAATDTTYLGQLAPGNYALTVTDANGCQDSASTSIALLGMISLQINGLAIPCNGQTGWLSATPVTGAAPFTWDWSGWSGTDSLAQPLGPGQYAVTVTDAYGCTASNTYPPMTEPSLITASIGTNPQTNLNTPNGTAVVTTTSGGSPAFPPSSPYEYSWNTGGMDHFIAGLTAGNYTVTISDRNGCTTVVEVLVDLLVGTEELEAQVVLMYPNPAADWVRVVLPEGRGAYSVSLSDENGRVLQTIAIPRGQAFAHLDLKDLPVGAYWLRVEGGIFKLIKQAN